MRLLIVMPLVIDDEARTETPALTAIDPAPRGLEFLSG
jgi:hypothetical protein